MFPRKKPRSQGEAGWQFFTQVFQRLCEYFEVICRGLVGVFQCCLHFGYLILQLFQNSQAFDPGLTAHHNPPTVHKLKSRKQKREK